MAKLIKAIRALAPRLKPGRKASMKEVVTFIAGRTGLNRGDILQVLNQFRETIVFFALAGRGVKLQDFATFTPKINMEGVISLTQRLDPAIKADLNAPKAFEGEILNRDMIGKTIDDVIARWNEENPDDLVEI